MYLLHNGTAESKLLCSHMHCVDMSAAAACSRPIYSGGGGGMAGILLDMHIILCCGVMTVYACLMLHVCAGFDLPRPGRTSLCSLYLMIRDG